MRRAAVPDRWVLRHQKQSGLCLKSQGAITREGLLDTYTTTYWIWWVLAAVLVGAELFTGTFYLLAVGVAFVSPFHW